MWITQDDIYSTSNLPCRVMASNLGASRFLHFYGQRVYICGLLVFIKEAYMYLQYILTNTHEKRSRSRFLQLRDVPEL